MSLKNVVKVMNFHSLLRVERSRKEAKKYTAMEDMVLDMLDNILNNRNIQMDVKSLQMDPGKPQLTIFMGSDLGFCGNLNNLVRKTRTDERKNGDQKALNVIIGRKLNTLKDNETILYQTREEFDESHKELLDLLSKGIREKQYSQIRLVYNHYRNTTQIDFVDKVIFPIPQTTLTTGGRKYKEDFIFEGDMQTLLVDLVDLYLQYEMEIAAQVSFAAENITRQNITTESLKKIDERDQEALQEERRMQKDKEFAKVLDNYTKLKTY